MFGYVEELQHHTNAHIRQQHFDPDHVFYDCMVPKCRSTYNHFKSLKRHILQQHPHSPKTPGAKRAIGERLNEIPDEPITKKSNHIDMETDFDTNSFPATEENFAFFEEKISLEQIKKASLWVFAD